MSPGIFSSGETNVPNNADETPSRDQSPETMVPNPVKLREKFFIVFNEAQLTGCFPILLESPIGRGGKDQVDAPGFKKTHLPGIMVAKTMGGGNIPERVLNGQYKSFIFCYTGQSLLMVFNGTYFIWKKVFGYYRLRRNKLDLRGSLVELSPHG